MGKTVKYKKSDLYEKVVDEYEVFDYGYEFMIFLAVMGYQEETSDREDYRGEGEIGLENLLNKELYRIIMASLAFQDTGDPETLVDVDRQERILAQYSAGGLQVAEQEFGQTAGDPTNAIVNYIKNHQNTERYQGTLGEIVSAFDNQMMSIEQE
jgi:hypothetical protein